MKTTMHLLCWWGVPTKLLLISPGKTTFAVENGLQTAGHPYSEVMKCLSWWHMIMKKIGRCQNPGLHGRDPTGISDLPGGGGVPDPEGLGIWQPWSKRSPSGRLPDDEVRVGLLHDEFLRTNVLLLSRVDDVPLLQDLHGKGFVFVALELNLQTRNEERQQPVIQFRVLFPAKSINATSHRGATHQLDPPKASNPQSVNDVEVSQVKVEEKRILCFVPVTPGKEGKCQNRIKDDMVDKRRDNPLPTSWVVTSICTLLFCLQILLDWICGNLSRMLLPRMWRFEDVWV